MDNQPKNSDFPKNWGKIVEPTQEWEADWNKLKSGFIAVERNEWWSSDEDFILNFIRRLLSQQAEKQREGFEAELERVINKCWEDFEVPDRCLTDIQFTYVDGYKKAIDDIIQIMKKK